MVRPSNEMKLYRNGQTGLKPNINGQTKQLIKTKYKWSDRAMRKEDNSPQGKIVTELLQVLTIFTSFNLQLDLFDLFFFYIRYKRQNRAIW